MENKKEMHSELANGAVLNASAIDNAISDVSRELRSNLATIRSFLHFLEIGQYKATEQELKEMHSKLDSHLEESQNQLIKKLDQLGQTVKSYLITVNK